MSAAPRPWIVTPHDPIEKLDDNLWAVTSQVPGIPVNRRMMIIKLSTGDLLFYHAVPVDDAALAEIRAWGRPAYLVIAHDQHGIDANPFKEKLGLRMFGPRASEAKMREKMNLDGTLDDLPSDPAYAIESCVGAKSGEPMITVKSGGGARTSLLFSDVVQNCRPEDTKLPFRLLGFAGPAPKVVPLFRLLFMKDRAALKSAIDRWAATPALTRLVPCHGHVETKDPAGSLRAIAAKL
jgi:hypothetical protein